MSVMSFSVGGHFNYIVSVAPSGWSDQSIMLRETERQRDRTKCAPPPPTSYTCTAFAFSECIGYLLLLLPSGLFGDSAGVRT